MIPFNDHIEGFEFLDKSTFRPIIIKALLESSYINNMLFWGGVQIRLGTVSAVIELEDVKHRRTKVQKGFYPKLDILELSISFSEFSSNKDYF